MFPTIKSFLKQSAALIALVGDRIYPDSVPDGESKPGLSMFLVSSVYGIGVDGTSWITGSSWQINCLADSRMTASAVADAVVTALHGKSYDTIKLAIITNRNDELPDYGTPLRRTIIDLELKHFT